MPSHLPRTAVLLLALACDSSTSPPANPGTGAFMRVYHTAKSAGDLSIRIDGVTVTSNLAFGSRADSLDVAPGSHTVTLVPTAPGRGAGAGTIVAVAGQVTTLVAVESLTVFIPQPLADTGGVVPAGKTKLRVAHLAAEAPEIAILRIQPDYPDPVSVMFPFDYGVVSPYLQSTPGNWWVIVTDSTPGDTLIKQGPIAIPDGERRTVVLIDGAAGSLQALVLDP